MNYIDSCCPHIFVACIMYIVLLWKMPMESDILTTLLLKICIIWVPICFEPKHFIVQCACVCLSCKHCCNIFFRQSFVHIYLSPSCRKSWMNCAFSISCIKIMSTCKYSFVTTNLVCAIKLPLWIGCLFTHANLGSKSHYKKLVSLFNCLSKDHNMCNSCINIVIINNQNSV